MPCLSIIRVTAKQYIDHQKNDGSCRQVFGSIQCGNVRKIQNGEVPEKDMWRYSSFWYKNFDDMAMKTMLRQLISKWGVVSIEMENVLKKDMAVIEF